MISTQELIEKFRQALSENWGYIWGMAGEKWTEAKQKALEKTTDADRAQGRLYGSKWIGHMVADCSGLFSWAFKQLGGYMYHGSDTMYRKYCNSKGELKKGKRTDGGTLKPGTAVFVWNGTKYSHVGLYAGDGTVIEAMGTMNGVTTSKVTAGKWSFWGELVGVDYDAGNEQLTMNNEQLSAAAGNQETKSVMVKVNSTNGLPVNLRTKPDKGAALVDRIPVGTEAELLGSQGAWSRIRVKGKAGWMMTEFLKSMNNAEYTMHDEGTDSSGAIPAAAEGAHESYSVTISDLDLTQAQRIAANYPGNSSIERECG